MIEKLLGNKLVLLALCITWTVLIFIGCSLPGRDLPPVHIFDHFDKVVHFLFFFVFSILWLLFLGNKLSNRLLFYMVFISFLYGFSLEYYQINFVPGRSWDVWDGVADGVGGLIGAITYRYFFTKGPKHNT